MIARPDARFFQEQATLRRRETQDRSNRQEIRAREQAMPESVRKPGPDLPENLRAV